MNNTVKIDKNINSQNVKMIAHRGLSGIEKENTCSAFIAAGNRESYFGIEADVHRTIDGRYVIIHDETTKRVSEEEIEISKSTFAQVRNVVLTDTDGNTERVDLRIPSLEEYICICKKYGKKAILELKCNFTKKETEEIIEIIKKESYLEDVIFISFFREPLLFVRSMLPNQKIQYLSVDFNLEILNFLKLNRFGFDVLFSALNDENVKALKEANIEINVWTVDKAEEAQRLINLGVDYITTNILE